MQEGKRPLVCGLDVDLIASAGDIAKLTPLGEIVMPGYPSGIWDEKNDMPVLRRGVTATHPHLDWNGRPEFLVDAACFPGSSGFPVFLFNVAGHVSKTERMVVVGSRVKLLGVL